MKKLLILLVLLLVPFVVKADDIEIKKIEVVEKSDDVEVNSDPVYKDGQLSFDLSFTNVSDFVKFKITIKNNTEEDLEVDKTPQYGKNKYIKYTIIYDEKNNLLKAGEEKVLYILATYDAEIPVDEFDNGEYNEQGNVELFVDNTKNPLTLSGVPLIMIGVLGLSIVSFIILRRQRKAILVLTLAVLITVPVVTNAARKINFSITSKIHIIDRPYVLDTDRGSFYDTETVRSITTNFDNNKYIYTTDVAWVQWAEKAENRAVLVLNVDGHAFTKDSYVRVYDLENNKLVKEVTSKDFAKPLYQVTSGYNFASTRYTKAIEGYSKEDLRIEVSADLQPAIDNGEYLVAYFMYTNSMNSISYKGPWISNLDTINQINHLSTYEDPTGLTLQGFERDSKDSHLYHAIWKEAPKEK